ncbi:hypothetical protein Tco_0961908 [Tanacetum coccineum]
MLMIMMEEKVDEKKGAEIGSLETRTEEIKTPIPRTPRSPRTILSSDKNITQGLTDIVSLLIVTTSKNPHSKRCISSKYSNLPECNAQAPKIIEELFKNYVQSNVIQVHPTTTTSTETTSSADLQQQLYLKMKRSLQDQGEKRVKRHKASKSSKSARGSSSKHSTKDSTTYVSKQQQQQEWDAWVEETVIDEDEVISEDETPKLITELQNVDKHVPTIFDRTRMEATLNDIFNQFKNAEEMEILRRRSIFLSLYKIHAERFPEADLEEKMNRWVHKEFKNLMKMHGYQFNIGKIHGIKECTRKIKEESETIQKTISLITGLQNRVIWERVHDFQLGIESYQFKVNLTTPTLTFPSIEAYEPYSIVDKPNTSLIYLNNKDEKLVMYLVKIVKFYDATLERVLKEVKLMIFQSDS